jgi:hypothetical protein
VCENRVLRIFGPKGNEAMGGWLKLHNEELHDSYFSPSIIRMIKPRRKKWAAHVARMGEEYIQNVGVFVSLPKHTLISNRYELPIMPFTQ